MIMKRIIDNLLYDTEESTLVYLDEETFRKYYKTKNDNYFCLFPNGEIRPMTEDSLKNLLGKTDEGIKIYLQLFDTPQLA